MKLFRYGPPGEERPGIVDKYGKLRDLSLHISEITAETLADDQLAALQKIDPEQLPELPADIRYAVPVRDIGKFVAIGLNYRDHAEEAGLAIPSEPVVFFKATTSISGANDPIIKPPHSTQLDWELELGVVIGKRTRYVSAEEALDHVCGYCVVNDVSDRGFQFQSSQWDKGKSCDSFGPIGPWLVTRDEIPDPQNLDMWLDVNGERRQVGNSATMIFSVAEIVSYCSRYMTLAPGDVICTGTPPGVSMGMKPRPKWLEIGDEVTLSIAGLGRQHHVVTAYRGLPG
ncbi:fumarylacetoacetate hydrolase family protein [Acetobacter peroxydans]|jgi:2-keto-4-pentenoate hydratase/2-oxohepta-3-ene-1,7-dioic acid hydratase in catechol pathway|uniref:2-hydroxyhepta-2,4-diene-1,7-dioate isomerase n=2 Tax=Acetobacter peroxydans TaxID=104098 RepID=A0A4Y3TQW1_9PROT|nr:fumarylacetoacetate hydrolase family protein [Acetobacter peroxydans]NHO16688.1 2-hydroxyhepta-2,4-diene-1,7-dioate isomerase [Acetobacter peroxydans]GBR39206.1 2-keto-4-pentenoate hydratase [Acetobacter peroxydans]GEB85411.1 2-hydroxyhepta-2,4-diene-1,7-dioate isomerase [Acetobacter peroxydans]